MARVTVVARSRLDLYIDTAAVYTAPTLFELRDRVPCACPAAVETIKWRAPAVDHNRFLGSFAEFMSCGCALASIATGCSRAAILARW